MVKADTVQKAAHSPGVPMERLKLGLFKATDQASLRDAALVAIVP